MRNFLTNSTRQDAHTDVRKMQRMLEQNPQMKSFFDIQVREGLRRLGGVNPWEGDVGINTEPIQSGISNIIDHLSIQALKNLAEVIYSPLSYDRFLELEEWEKHIYFHQSADSTVAILIYEFISGTGQNPREFREGDKIVEEFQDYKPVEDAIEEFYEINRETNEFQLKPLEPKTYEFSPNSSILEDFNLKDSAIAHFRASGSWARLFVGGFNTSVYQVSETELEVRINNQTSRNSLLLHLGENTIDPNSELSTITQDIVFRVPIDFSKLPNYPGWNPSYFQQR